MEGRGVPHFFWISKPLNLRDWTKEMDKGLGGFLEIFKRIFSIIKTHKKGSVCHKPYTLKTHS